MVTFPNPDLTMISYVVTTTSPYLFEITRQPDLIVAETMLDRNLAYIDMLCTSNGDVVTKSKRYQSRSETVSETLPTIICRP